MGKLDVDRRLGGVFKVTARALRLESSGCRIAGGARRGSIPVGRKIGCLSWVSDVKAEAAMSLIEELNLTNRRGRAIDIADWLRGMLPTPVAAFSTLERACL